MKRLSTLLMLTACLALNGCGLLGDSPETPEYKPSPVENFMANAVPGDITTLSDPAFGTDVRVSMEDSFFSAAGEECKRATVRNHLNEAEIIVACRNAQGQWRLAPRVWGQGMSPAVVTASQTEEGKESARICTMKNPVFLLLLCLLLLPQAAYAADAPAPYGANLFQGNFGQGAAAGAMAPGDRVVLRLWGGSLNVDTVLEVSPAGQLDIPEVGQLNVTGLAQDKLQDALRSKLAASGHADSQIYLAPMDAQPITLFVTGNVPKPGRYSGSAADPLLSYLDKAGGIDAGRGSYRNIQVRRNDQVVTTVDLYPFIREGSMPPIRFQNGDIIVVPDKGPTVTVTGKVRTSARFELPEGNTSGASLLKLVDPDSSASHIAIKGVRNGKPYNTYLPLGELASLQLADGDTIELLADAAGNTITVTVQGAVRGATRFPVRRGARLDEVRNFIAVEQGRADLNGMYIKRKSVAARQKKAIADSLRRLEESALTASSASTEESQIRAKEAEMIAKFVERAKAVEPEGVVVLSDGQKIGDITLEDGDVIVIPAKSDVVLVSGEVMMPQAMLWSKKKDLDDYIKGAGGYNSRADQDTVLVMHPNGSVSHDGDNIRPGDQILVMPRVASKNMQAVKDISQVMMQVAVSARAILGLPTLY